jgi:hypothetical protein
MKIFFKNGFTLIEVLALIAILLLGLVGILAATTFTYRSLGSSEDVLTASLLAQEGLEIVRNVRDNNRISGQPFNANMVDNTDYRVSYESTALKPANANAFLYQANTTGLYGYLIADGGNLDPATSTITKFRRTVHINFATDTDLTGPGGSPNYLNVTSTVSWGSSANQSSTLSTFLYDWRP